jgi:hypothetical protein
MRQIETEAAGFEKNCKLLLACFDCVEHQMPIHES